MPDTALWVHLACVWEATARKPGNVHRFADSPGLHYLDFLQSAAAVAPVLGAALGRPVGATVLDCVRASRRVAGTNTNLGIVLLLAPMAAVPPGEELRAGLARVLAGLTVEDARLAYEAIRLAQPGGLGRAAEQDVADEPTVTLRAAMELAAGRDAVARQYATDYADVFGTGLPALADLGAGLEAAVVRCALEFLSRVPDSLIARKHGPAAADVVSAEARAVLAGASAAEFDARLRGRRWNPGTTADLVTASLFAALRTGAIRPPVRWGPEGGER